MNGMTSEQRTWFTMGACWAYADTCVEADVENRDEIVQLYTNKLMKRVINQLENELCVMKSAN